MCRLREHLEAIGFEDPETSAAKFSGVFNPGFLLAVDPELLFLMDAMESVTEIPTQVQLGLAAIAGPILVPRRQVH